MILPMAKEYHLQEKQGWSVFSSQLSGIVDGWNPANQLRLVVCPSIYKVLYIPGGAGFLPSPGKTQDGSRKGR